MTSGGTPAYDDGRIACDEGGITIRGYSPWGARRIAYSTLRDVVRLPLGRGVGLGRGRIWGSGDLVHWWNLDPRRPGKDTALVLDVGGRVRPTITPEDPDAVEQILRAHLPR